METTTLIILLISIFLLIALFILLCFGCKRLYKKYLKKPVAVLPFHVPDQEKLAEEAPVIIIQGEQPKTPEPIKVEEHGDGIQERGPENNTVTTPESRKITPREKEDEGEEKDLGNNSGRIAPDSGKRTSEEDKQENERIAPDLRNSPRAIVTEKEPGKSVAVGQKSPKISPRISPRSFKIAISPRRTNRRRNNKIQDINHQIEEGELKNYVIFTDGSENGHRCGFGVYAGWASDLNTCTALVGGEMSSNIAELQGIIQPLKRLIMEQRNHSNLFIHVPIILNRTVGTDSLFTIIGLEWIQMGKAPSLNGPYSTRFELEQDLFYIKYYNYLTILYSLATVFNSAYLFHVPAHQSIAQNEMADIFAKLSIFKGRKYEWRKVVHNNARQRRDNMNTYSDLVYCKINRELKLEFDGELVREILDQPTRKMYNLTDVIRMKRMHMTVETAIWRTAGMGSIVDTDELISRLMEGDQFTWEEVLTY